MPRLFRYSHQSYSALRANKRHTFAQEFALNIYPSEAIYTFIPKNGCSTMRTSLAVANGCIRDSSDFNWIHQNNNTFAASLPELARAKYTFTILRCPFSRLLSVYLDKIVNRNHPAWRYIDLHQRKIEIEDITFEFFVKSMGNERIRNGDIHWTPQTHFLVYDEYDDYFAFEEFPRMCVALKERIDFDVIDARPLTRHGTDGYRRLARKTPFRIGPLELLDYKRQGFVPSIKTMYSDELVTCVKRAFKHDIALYKRKFGAGNLFAC